MFKNLIALIRQVLYRMGLIKGIQKLTDNKKIAADEQHYKLIDMWLALYRGYLETGRMDNLGIKSHITPLTGHKHAACTR